MPCSMDVAVCCGYWGLRFWYAYAIAHPPIPFLDIALVLHIFHVYPDDRMLVNFALHASSGLSHMVDQRKRSKQAHDHHLHDGGH